MGEYEILVQEIVKQQNKFLLINIGILMTIVIITFFMYISRRNISKKMYFSILLCGNIVLTIIMFVNLAIFTLIVDGGGKDLYEATRVTSNGLTLVSVMGVLISAIEMLLMIFKSKKVINVL